MGHLHAEPPPAVSPEMWQLEATPAVLDLLARQIQVLEAIATMVGALTAQTRKDAQADFILARRRLLEEAI